MYFVVALVCLTLLYFCLMLNAGVELYTVWIPTQHAKHKFRCYSGRNSCISHVISYIPPVRMHLKRSAFETLFTSVHFVFCFNVV